MTEIVPFNFAVTPGSHNLDQNADFDKPPTEQIPMFFSSDFTDLKNVTWTFGRWIGFGLRHS
jgi:hypothetical protein